MTDATARAAEAAFLIDNRLLKECRDAIVSAAIEVMISAPVSDDEGFSISETDPHSTSYVLTFRTMRNRVV